MNIIYDDIVYSLQKAGGVSVVWANTTKDIPFHCVHIRYKGTDNNQCASFIEGHEYIVKNNKFLQLKRYINPKMRSIQKPFIFHSSYYRYCLNKNAINITTVHDFTYEYFDKRLKGKLHKWQKKRAIMHSDGVICISENTKNDLQKYYPTYNGLIKVINNAYDNKTYFYENTKKEKIILSVGARGGYKRFDLTVCLAKALEDCRLIIVGGGKLTDSERKILDRELYDRYEQVGYLSNDELRNLYNKSFFLSYCSDYEGFGIPPIEAQACGCPVVCQAKSSLPEVVRDSAVFIDPLDMDKSILEVKKLYNEHYYNSIIEKGLENAKRFSWEKSRAEIVKFYNELYAKREAL